MWNHQYIIPLACTDILLVSLAISVSSSSILEVIRSRCNAFLASSCLPFWTNHLGLSGKANGPANAVNICKRGAAFGKNRSDQFCSLPRIRIYPTKLAQMTAKHIVNWNVVTMVPLISELLISPKYVGITDKAIPDFPSQIHLIQRKRTDVMNWGITYRMQLRRWIWQKQSSEDDCHYLILFVEIQERKGGTNRPIQNKTYPVGSLGSTLRSSSAYKKDSAEDNTNMTSITSIAAFRPYLSCTGPATNAPTCIIR